MRNDSKQKFSTRDIAFYGLFTALIYVATRFINIQGPTPGSLFHLGNVMAFSIAIVFGKKAGAISAALGMALFDITSGFTIWAPFTFVIRLVMGYVIGYMAAFGGSHKGRTIAFSILGILFATIIMIGGYYVSEVILYRNIYAPLQSVGANFMQCVVGTVLGLPLAITLRIGLKARSVNLEM